jgi:hypothetical protein
MNKKIALMLIIFMIGTWCVFAEDDEEMSPILIMGIAVGAVLLIGGTLAIIAAASGDSNTAQNIMNSLASEKPGKDIPATLEKPEKEIAAIAKTVMENPILKHTTLGFSKDKVVVGLRFAW